MPDSGPLLGGGVGTTGAWWPPMLPEYLPRPDIHLLLYMDGLI